MDRLSLLRRRAYYLCTLEEWIFSWRLVQLCQLHRDTRRLFGTQHRYCRRGTQCDGQEQNNHNSSKLRKSSVYTQHTIGIFHNGADGNKAAASEEVKRTLRYVESLSDARTKPGERRVSARRGWAGEKRGFFSILLEAGSRSRTHKDRRGIL